MFQADYKRDIHNHYLIIQKEQQDNQYSFRLKMLMNNKIPGLLNLDIRMEDNIIHYYYDITSKQAITFAFEKGLLTYAQVKQLIKGILSGLELGRTYLLNEDDFVLNPAYIYLQLASFEVYLCYVADYKQDIREQFCGFIEYMMDKVDYTDDRAVLLIYGLYKISRNEDFTFDRINEILDKENKIVEQDNIPEEHGNGSKEYAYDGTRTSSHVPRLEQNQSPENRRQENKELRNESSSVQTILKQQPQCREEKKRKEEETGIPQKALGFALLLVITSILVIVVIAKTGILNNDLGTRLDYKKALVFLVIIGIIEAYVLNYIFKKYEGMSHDSENISQLFENKEIQFRCDNYSTLKEAKGLETESNSMITSNNLIHQETPIDERVYNTKEIYLINAEETALLQEFAFHSGYKLLSKSNGAYQDIQLSEFPFVLGKMKTNVDSVIDNNKISRIHARIEHEGEEFYITDLNSTNGTYINNDRLELNEKRKLVLEDEIMLANVKYSFCKV